MKKPDDINKAIEQQANAQLDQQTDALPDHVLAQLKLARQQAVAQASQAKTTHWYESKPLLAIAASALLALPLIWITQDRISETDSAPQVAAAVVSPSSKGEMGLMDLEEGSESITESNVGTSEIMLQLAELSEEDMAIVNDLEFIAWLNENQAHQLDG